MTKGWCTRFVGIWLLTSIPLSAMAFLVEQEAQRRDYLTAIEAIKAGNEATYQRLTKKLQDYILHGYLRYEYLTRNLATSSSDEIRIFLAKNENAPISAQLRKKWLHLLANRGEWRLFVVEYREVGSSELHCLYLSQILKQERDQAALMREIEQLWHTGRRLPSACEPVFLSWKKAGHMTTDKVWERIRLAMERRNVSLAHALAKHLEPGDRIWVTRWADMHRNPPAELNRINYPVETPVARMIVKHGIVRLAYRDPDAAMEEWLRLKTRYQFFGEDENYVMRYLGILAAQDHLPHALDWLSEVSAEPDDQSLHLWRVKTALRAGEWGMVKQFIAALPEEDQRDPQWRYWLARAQHHTGQKQEAKRLFTQAAQDRSYYGFLSADRINLPYSMQHAGVAATPEEVSAMLAMPGIQMASELLQLGETVQARRQWHWTISHMTNRELQVAAVIARQWGWHDRAILTVSKSDHLDDLELRFPVLYRDLIEANAREYGIDPSWVYGVVRQESAFVADARSGAGALGLMQLMPATGRLTGRKLKMKIRNNSALLNIENNLKIGTTYLKEVLQRYRGNQVLATASYNAGPHRVKQWLPDKDMDAEIWVESIPYSETRNYVKNVMAFTAVYDYRLGLNPTRLDKRMSRIEPLEAKE
jgi:soluble lytic murein transglycosylase